MQLNPKKHRPLLIAVGWAIASLLSGCERLMVAVLEESNPVAIAADITCEPVADDERPLLPEQVAIAVNLSFPQSRNAVTSRLGRPSSTCGRQESYNLPQGGSFVVIYGADSTAIDADWRN